MIVVKIEMVSARTGETTEIGRMYLANVGGTVKRGDYKAAVCRRGSTVPPAEFYPNEAMAKRAKAPKATRHGDVEDYPRMSYNVWRLVLRALRSCFPEEK